MHISIHAHMLYINTRDMRLKFCIRINISVPVEALKQRKRKKENKEAGIRKEIRSVRVAFIKTGLGTGCKGRMR